MADRWHDRSLYEECLQAKAASDVAVDCAQFRPDDAAAERLALLNRTWPAATQTPKGN